MRKSGPRPQERQKRVSQGGGGLARGAADAAKQPSAPARAKDRAEHAVVAGLILVGRFGAPQGVRGEIRIQSYTADPLALCAYAPLTDASGTRVFALSALRSLRDTLVVATVAGINDRDAAAALTGIALYARRELLPPPDDDDEFYVADLVGLAAVDIAGETIGTVVAVQNFGAGDLLEIAPAAGGDTLLVPFTKAFAPTLDVAGGRVTVRVPEAEAVDPAKSA